ncbi:MAG: hypothetical protein IJ860_09030 [Eubacterium sp.]|nr:hypothetical protein [Eubacterium sp.]
MAKIKMEFVAASVMKSIEVIAYLPAFNGFPGPEPPFKTVYFLPGMADSAETISEMAGFLKYSQSTGMAIVTFASDNSFYVDRPMACYGQLIEEVISNTRQILPLSDRREDTYLAGYSMGGYGAFCQCMRRPDLFAKAALAAPGFDAYQLINPFIGGPMIPHEYLDTLFTSEEEYNNSANNYRIALKQFLDAGKELPELCLCAGRQDPLVKDVVEAFRTFLDENNVAYSYQLVDGAHDQMFVDNMMPVIMNFFAVKSRG